MPAKPAWLLHLSEIVEQLEVFDVPVVDRAIVERVFGLHRRRAIELLHRFGGYQAGRTFLIDRRLLIGQLRCLIEGEEFQREKCRKERLVGTIEQLQRYRAGSRVKIPTPRDDDRRMASLPTGIVLEHGHLHIEFAGTEELLAKLYELSQAASNDFDRFREAAEPVQMRTA